MTDNPPDPIPHNDRVSIRAVLVRDGEDPGPALAAAGIHDPIAVPVVVSEDPHAADGILGNAATPNLIAILQVDQPDDPTATTGDQPDQAATRSGKPATPTASPLSGPRASAPNSRSGNPRSGRFVGAADIPPSPAQSLALQRGLSAGWKQPGPYRKPGAPKKTAATPAPASEVAPLASNDNDKSTHD